MKKKALEFLEAASTGWLSNGEAILVAIAYAILALVEVCEEKK